MNIYWEVEKHLISILALWRSECTFVCTTWVAILPNKVVSSQYLLSPNVIVNDTTGLVQEECRWESIIFSKSVEWDVVLASDAVYSFQDHVGLAGTASLRIYYEGYGFGVDTFELLQWFVHLIGPINWDNWTTFGYRCYPWSIWCVLVCVAMDSSQ